MAYQNNDKTGLDSFMEVLKRKNIEWKKEYHKYYSKHLPPMVLDQVFHLLLFSKYRCLSNSILIKGITLIIIKYLCQIEQQI